MTVKQQSDFKIEYHWAEGSVPPPYHYEYSLILHGDGTGFVSYWPDYDMPGVPFWQRKNSIPPKKYEPLKTLIEQDGLISHIWRQFEVVPVGGSQEWCKGIVSGRILLIPTELIQEDADKARVFYSEIKQIVPQKLWDEFSRLRNDYMNRFAGK